MMEQEVMGMSDNKDPVVQITTASQTDSVVQITTASQTGPVAPKQKKKRYYRFRDEYLTDSQFSGWLQQCPSNPKRGVCNACKITFLVNRYTLNRHLTSARHQQSIQKEQMADTVIEQDAISNPENTSNDLLTMPDDEQFSRDVNTVNTELQDRPNVSTKATKNRDTLLADPRFSGRLQKHQPEPQIGNLCPAELVVNKGNNNWHLTSSRIGKSAQQDKIAVAVIEQEPISVTSELEIYTISDSPNDEQKAKVEDRDTPERQVSLTNTETSVAQFVNLDDISDHVSEDLTMFENTDLFANNIFTLEEFTAVVKNGQEIWDQASECLQEQLVCSLENMDAGDGYPKLILVESAQESLQGKEKEMQLTNVTGLCENQLEAKQSKNPMNSRMKYDDPKLERNAAKIVINRLSDAICQDLNTKKFTTQF